MISKSRLNELYLRNARFFEQNLVIVGWLGFIGYPLYYWIWTELFPQDYESLPVRLIASAISIPLIFYNYWPEPFKRKHQPWYWYITITFLLPFTMGFHLFQNDFSPVWVVCIAMTIYVMVIVMVDWYVALFFFVVGLLLAWLLYLYQPFQPINWSHASIYLPLFGFAVFSAALFNKRNQDNIRLQEQVNGIEVGGLQLANELQDSLHSSRKLAESLNTILPELSEGYWKALHAGEHVPMRELPSDRMISSMGDAIRKDMHFANAVVDMILLNAQSVREKQEMVTRRSMRRIVADALERYPFAHGDYKEVQLEHKEDFHIEVPLRMMVYIVMMVLRSTFHLAGRVRPDELRIIIEPSSSHSGSVYIRHEKVHLSEEDCDALFVEESVRGQAASIGLSYARRAIKRFGGNLAGLNHPELGFVFELKF